MASARKSNVQRRPSPNPAGKEPTPDAATVANVSGGTAAVLRAVPSAAPPDPEVRERAARRRFTAEYKLRIVREADACTGSGELGALLRREGLYSSHLTTWRRQRDAGALSALTPKKRGRPAVVTSPLARRVAELERDKAKLERRLKRAETIIEVQKKLSEILGIPLKTPDDAGSDC
jgi:transposase